MTRSRLLIHHSRQLQQRQPRRPRIGQVLVRAASAAGHLAKQFEQHRAFGSTQPAC